MPNKDQHENDLLWSQKNLKFLIKTMKPSHYIIKSEYHRLMYEYYLQLEIINKTLLIKK